jgi:hypothetical protein
VSKIYIAGPVTGIDGYAARFAAAELAIKHEDHEAVNPAALGSGGGRPWSWYMRRALTLMLTCDAVYMLDRWEESRGATFEHYTAVTCGMPVFIQRPYPVNWRSELGLWLSILDTRVGSL